MNLHWPLDQIEEATYGFRNTQFWTCIRIAGAAWRRLWRFPLIKSGNRHKRSRLLDALLRPLKFAENLSFRSAPVATHR
eukprot:COSAG06_NODE_4985_length_3806_cov_2.019153_3_plen_79_part_00